MIDYQNSKIYKLSSLKTDEYYIGGTTQSLEQREKDHRRDYLSQTSKLYRLGEVKIQLIKKCPCNNKDELNVIIKKYRSRKIKPGLTKKEYQAQYRLIHKEKMLLYQKNNYKKNKERICEVNKKYYYANFDKIQKKQIQYRLKNYDKMKEYQIQYRLKKKINSEN